MNYWLVGTEAVVRDIDYLAKVIEGENKPVNCKSGQSIPSEHVD
jgi:hypothetical protein